MAAFAPGQLDAAPIQLIVKWRDLFEAKGTAFGVVARLTNDGQILWNQRLRHRFDGIYCACPPSRWGGTTNPFAKADGDALASVFEWAQHRLDQDLAIDRLASRAGMSRRTFIRRFEEATGMSPGDWVVQTRVLRARELLEATQLSIESIAAATGFGSAETLRHHFRHRIGRSPMRYRAVFQMPARAGG
ncbi:helix-turn-helix domain-containing protein [Bradyrhizobium zhanjiangense]|uniref:helix-turn-helix domain-containing protein n=1 Tax=Bradyrhizobium zhanjiangense TaxID=1325107 RepID=UPI0013E8AD1F|nr:helix-turn-helix domain-containing protein [Bradyrhizobium zhanjiangense]